MESCGALTCKAKIERHTCTVVMCPPLKGEAEVMKGSYFLNAT